MQAGDSKGFGRDAWVLKHVDAALTPFARMSFVACRICGSIVTTGGGFPSANFIWLTSVVAGLNGTTARPSIFPWIRLPFPVKTAMLIPWNAAP
jgi:hypothetical protein